MTMTGYDCASGNPLRFWYPPDGTGGELPQPVDKAPEQGSRTATIPALHQDDDALGYMLFTGPGRWNVDVRQNGRPLGTIVFTVP
jgi:hypothetical protein